MSRRKNIKPEQVFYDHIYKLINNLFVNNINYKTGHCYGKTITEMIHDNQEKGKYILEQMENSKHLIIEEEEDVSTKT